MAPRSTENRSKTCDNADSSWPCLLVVGLDTTGVEASLALSDAGHCSLTLGDDRCATPDWRSMVSCLIRGVGSPAAAQTSGATTRSQVMANILSSLGRRAVQALSPVGDASVVERFAAMILADPTLPQAMAYNEHVCAYWNVA